MYTLNLTETEYEVLKQMRDLWKEKYYYLLCRVKSYPPEIYEGKKGYDLLCAGDTLCRKINLLDWR